MNTTNRKRLIRTITHGLVMLAAGLGCSVVIPGCGVGYVVRSAYFQAELLNSRDAIEEVRGQGSLNESQLAKLELILSLIHI